MNLIIKWESVDSRETIWRESNVILLEMGRNLGPDISANLCLPCISVVLFLIHAGFFSQNIWWGDLAFGDDFRSPSGMEPDGGGGTRVGDRVRWGGTWINCPLRPKMLPYSKIGANLGFLRGYCTSYPQKTSKICMFCALSQNYQHLFDKIISRYLIVNFPRNSKVASKLR